VGNEFDLTAVEISWGTPKTVGRIRHRLAALEARLPRRLLVRVVAVPRAGTDPAAKAAAALFELIAARRAAVANDTAANRAARARVNDDRDFLHGLAVADVTKWDGARSQRDCEAWPAALKTLITPHAAAAVAEAFPSYDALHRAVRARGPAAISDLRKAGTATHSRVGPAAAKDLHALLSSSNPGFKLT
jgi:hypothetical protein